MQKSTYCNTRMTVMNYVRFTVLDKKESPLSIKNIVQHVMYWLSWLQNNSDIVQIKLYNNLRMPIALNRRTEQRVNVNVFIFFDRINLKYMSIQLIFFLSLGSEPHITYDLFVYFIFQPVKKDILAQIVHGNVHLTVRVTHVDTRTDGVLVLQI